MTPSSKMNILLIALLLLLGINIYELIVLKRCGLSCQDIKTTIIKPKHCDDFGRYSPNDTARGGKEIDSVLAGKMVDDYRNLHAGDTTIYKTTGFSFSKKVFDQIFDKKNTALNMVRLNLAIDQNNRLCLIAQGVRTTYSEISHQINLNPRGIFITESFCPFDCQLD